MQPPPLRCCGRPRWRMPTSWPRCAKKPSAASTCNRGPCCVRCLLNWPMVPSACCWSCTTWWWMACPGGCSSRTCKASTANSRCRPRPRRSRPGPSVCRPMPAAKRYSRKNTSGCNSSRTCLPICPAVIPMARVLAAWRRQWSADWTPSTPGNYCNRRLRPIAPRSTICC
ncbi:hypothetical protein FX984_06380 [Pseudomonas marginalis]|nr:hypothetical protein FX984_06380 [Pseudomonas marginalis]